MHGLALPRHLLIHFAFHSGECGCDPALGKRAVQLYARIVKPKLDHR